ncbi:MAG TPA: formyltransferase family protein [Nocardioides sp.]|uniref:formyltransferase family protein n=1 Tax=Nocardioides sp. TaxID=35761 RepID=UPI002ED9977A
MALIGCVESSEMALRTLLELGSDAEVVGVVTKERSLANADFVDLAPLCDAHEIPRHYEANGRQADSLSFLQDRRPDVVYCIGWSHLLNRDALSVAPLGTIGFHPAALPQNRGRHPIIWALALGLASTASTFFQMDEGADSGPILSQCPVPIWPEDDAGSLYARILGTAREQIRDVTRDLAHGTAVLQPQDHSQATYWRKRTRRDGVIDWRMPASDIHNLVRALAPPYPGAEFEWRDTTIVVARSRVHRMVVPSNVEPGKVLDVKERTLLVKCGGGSAVWIEPAGESGTPQIGEYL